MKKQAYSPFSLGDLHKIGMAMFLILFAIFTAHSQSGSFGNTFVHGGTELSVFSSSHDFLNGGSGVLPGVIGTERATPIGVFGFVGTASHIGASDDAHVDGYVRTYGTDSFTFPIGDNNKYRPVAVSTASSGAPASAAYFGVNPSVAITSSLKGGNEPVLPAGGPFNSSSMGSGLSTVSTTEYWDVQGSTPAQLTFTWDAASNISDLTVGQLSSLTIIGWDGFEWVVIPSAIDETALLGGSSTLSTGSITTITPLQPDAYSVYTFGGLVEDTDGDGVADGTDSHPTDPCLPVQIAGYTGYDSSNTIWSAADCDGDGVDNGTEVTNGTDPYLSDLVVFDVHVFLEGPLSEGSMSTRLNDFDYLPGEVNNPVAGHPYSGVPWNHTNYLGMEYGDDGIPYPATVVDWVMISVRANGFAAQKEVYRAAALLHTDGTVEIPAAEGSLRLSSLGVNNYIVIEHRNHLAVISDKVSVSSGNVLSFDFRANDSGDPNGHGGLRQQMRGGQRAMYTGNMQQSSPGGRTTFDGNDVNAFLPANGVFGYQLADFNLDLLVTGADINNLIIYHGQFGSVTWN